ncbi:hypothetical protein PRK78_000045 [Emydomyces testavorans]|uniref:Uncharacterized protein n=1 Tax=Emydomyces testavorans TaxID=2070801 RepID=A0AAF0IE21_9EURO|nr:hypothetical protein PRK78_000045 [Emydomyces testavorans]
MDGFRPSPPPPATDDDNSKGDETATATLQGLIQSAAVSSKVEAPRSCLPTKMSSFKGIMREGWHPKGGDGGRESWRGDFKGINQVAGWVGKGKSPNVSQRTEHVARPMSTLRDPSSFAPPPRRTNTASGVSYTSSVPLHHQAETAEPARPAPPPVPYRADTTGRSANHLPTPPMRHDSPPGTNAHDYRSTEAKSKPSLPPRLPPRCPSNTSPSPPPPPYEATQRGSESYLNQGAMSRLANAGVSAPALGIQRLGSHNSHSQRSSQTSTSINPTNELQSRFAQLKTSSSSPISSNPNSTPSPLQGVTPQQLHTAATAATHVASQPAFQQAVVNSTSSTDPRPSLPGRTSSFRERHDEQIQSVKGKLNGLNQKYGITKRINSFIEDQKSPANPDAPPPPGQPATHQSAPNHPYSSPNTSRPDLDALNRRKPPPPPPPPKKLSMHSKPVNQSPSPPPLPLNTKPR